jgi:HlyD family secretion protein
MKASKNFLILFILFILSCSSNGDKKLRFTGVIEGTSVKIPALTGGEIIKLFTDTGHEVTKGQPIAQIDTSDLSYQRANAEAIMQEISVQEQIALTDLKRTGQELSYIKTKYQRYVKLLDNESVPEQTVDDLKNRLENIEAKHRAARQLVESLQAKKKQAFTQYQSVVKKIKDAQISSSLSGTVVTKYFEEGEAIPNFAAIFEVIHLDEVWVKIYISEKLLPVLRTGQEAEIFPDGTDRVFRGTISWINSKAEFTPKTILTEETRTSLVYAVKITIQNDERILKHGMPVEVMIEK